jgi:hypothetical protein
MSSEEPEPRPIGWYAITDACKRAHGEQEPRHWGTILSSFLGGKDPLHGISAYAVDAPVRHWHFISYGFSELYEKEWENPAVSGFGFEVTLRLARNDEAEPPGWALNFLQNLARYVFQTGNGFEPGHHVDLNGPIALGSPTKIKAIAFMEDPQLGTMETPNGRVQFLQIVGITLDELRAIKRWDTKKFLESTRDALPLGMTDLARDTLLSVPAVRTAVEEGCSRDGSSTAALHVQTLMWKQERRLIRGTKTRITLKANAVGDFGSLLLGRIGHGRTLAVIGKDAVVVFEPGDRGHLKVDDGEQGSVLHVKLTSADANGLSERLQPKAGIYEVPGIPGLEILVERAEIKDSDGRVVEVIG